MFLVVQYTKPLDIGGSGTEKVILLFFWDTLIYMVSQFLCCWNFLIAEQIEKNCISRIIHIFIYTVKVFHHKFIEFCAKLGDNGLQRSELRKLKLQPSGRRPQIKHEFWDLDAAILQTKLVTKTSRSPRNVLS